MLWQLQTLTELIYGLVRVYAETQKVNCNVREVISHRVTTLCACVKRMLFQTDMFDDVV